MNNGHLRSQIYRVPHQKMSFIFNDGPVFSYCEAQENIGEAP